MTSPKIKKVKKELTTHGHTRIDNYYWLNDRKNREVIAYLKAENTYTDAVFNSSTKDLQKKLYHEMKSRIPQKDQTVPYLQNGYEYYVRYEEGKEYPVYCRKKQGYNQNEEILLNGNKMAEGHSYYDIGDFDVSSNNSLIAFSVDLLSRRKYSIFIKNLVTGELYGENIRNTTGEVVWANDNKTLFYVKKDRTLRPFKIFRHVLGTLLKKDKLVFQEKDTAFETFIFKSKSCKYLIIGSESTLSTEYRILEADKPERKFRLFQPRTKDVEYHIAHQGKRFLIRTNYKAENFRLMECSKEKTAIESWKEIIPNRKDVFLEEVEVFSKYFVATERKNGLIMLRIFDLKAATDRYLTFDEKDYFVWIDDNYDYNSSVLRFGYTSLKTPSTIYDEEIQTAKRILRKRQKVVGGYAPDDYLTERKYVTAHDGAKIPVSIVYKKEFRKNGSCPLLLYGYGSYGYTIESSFRSSRLSLLNRGFAFAIAHVRGGQEMGRYWYDEGKLLNKKNTFSDFIDCAKALIVNHYTSPKKLFAMGGSAGGLLMGAVANLAPGLFKGIIADVPFVDVVTTMLDESIPLTTGEYDEWGNPNDKVYYNYMLSYSPYDNVETKSYPAMLITTGLHDSQVQFWEPAKWVAKLRDMKTDNNLLLLWTNMDYGHSGASGRFEQFKEIAMDYVFMFYLLNINK